MITFNYDIKSSSSNIFTLIMDNYNSQAFKVYMKRKVEQAPYLFENMPIIIDVDIIKDDENLESIIKEVLLILKFFKLNPIGIKNPRKNSKELFKSMKLAVYHDSKIDSNIMGNVNKSEEIHKDSEKTSIQASPQTPVEQPKELFNQDTIIYDNLVRGGQQVYAKNKNLMILGSVKINAEVVATGNVFILGDAEGRIIAGADGPENSKIIVSGKLKAQMISINGVYRVIEETDDFYNKQNVYITLEAGKLVLKAIHL